MKGKAKCPHCKQKVVVEVPLETTGTEVVTCPNCDMQFKVNVDEPYSWEEDAPLIHPSMHIKPKSMKIPIASLLLIIVFLLGIVISGALFFSMDIIEDADRSSQYNGKVVDTNGDSLAGVDVSVIDHPEWTTITDDNGKFSFSNITSGKRTLQFMLDGYITLEAEVFVLPWDVSIPQEQFTMKNGSGANEDKTLIVRVLELGPILAGVVIILSAIALAGAIMALMRIHFPIVVLGAVCGIVAGFFSIIGIPLGIVALILILLAKEEFQGTPTEMKY